MAATVIGMAMVMGFGATRIQVGDDGAGDLARSRAPVVSIRVPAIARAAAISGRELECLASAIWYEAGNQPHEGRVAVAEVVLARMRSGLYPKRACAVIAQRSQFSFVRRGIIPAVPVAQAVEMRRIATAVAEGRQRSRIRGALWFHATYVSPGWDVPRLGRIGTHIFYGTKA